MNLSVRHHTLTLVELNPSGWVISNMIGWFSFNVHILKYNKSTD